MSETVPGSFNSGSISYTYDVLGRRVSRTQSGNTTIYVYDGPHIIAEYSGSTGSLIRKYIYGPGIDEPIYMIDVMTGNRYYYFYDGLGSVAALSNANNAIIETYCYDAFGRTKINTTAGPDGNWLTPDGTLAATSQYGNRFMFTGREYDCETGLYDYRARYYDPQTGRFLQRDPLQYVDGMNLYVYVRNNSIKYLDSLV